MTENNIPVKKGNFANGAGIPVGRPKGSKNKATVQRERILGDFDVKKMMEDPNFTSPLAYLIGIYSDVNNDIPMRIDAAKHCLPYMHKKQPTAATMDINTSDKSININLVGNNKPPQDSEK